MRVRLKNVGIIDDCDIKFVPGINLIIGSSGSGKSTLMRSIYNIASNEFADSDISFGKNSMHIRVDYNGNSVEYSRSIKSKGDRFYYLVNGEKYAKVGRTVLPAVADVLKICDVDVNGENINFNFNLQFSSPFLILGNQSTLYNVLTYRSSFDISSINDYYAIDVKSNANEIASNVKLKDRLIESLEDLENQSEKLYPVEQLYSDFMVCKHKSTVLDELKSLLDKLKLDNDITNKKDLIESTIDKVSTSISNASILIELKKYSNIVNEYSELGNAIKVNNNFIKHYSNAIALISNKLELCKLLSMMNTKSTLDSNIAIFNKCVTSAESVLLKDSVASDVDKLHKLLITYNKYTLIFNLLNEADCSRINRIDELLNLDEKLNCLDNVNSSIDDIEQQCNTVKEQIDKFDVCPLCGSSLHNHKSC